VVRLARRLVAVVVAIGVVYVGVTFVQVWRASGSDRARKAQAIVVLGAAQYDGRPSPVLTARLDHALELYRRGIAPKIVTTGGNRPGDRFTEASAGASYLIRHGVPSSALELEVHGESSWESLAAAARFLRREHITDVVLVSSPWHALRTVEIAGEVGLDGRSSPATEHESTSKRLYHLGRETIAVAVGRIVGHRRLVDLSPRHAPQPVRPGDG
jgi:vancomycin permeability regulator SanA